MTPYVQREVFRAFEQEVYRKAERAVRSLGPEWGNELRCHELARAVHRFLDIGSMHVVDGKLGICEHSWLEIVVPIAETENGKSEFVRRRVYQRATDNRWMRRVILDVYVPGRLPQVQLIDPFPLLKPVYEEGEPRDDIEQSIVDKAVKQMRDIAVYGAIR